MVRPWDGWSPYNSSCTSQTSIEHHSPRRWEGTMLSSEALFSRRIRDSPLFHGCPVIPGLSGVPGSRCPRVPGVSPISSSCIVDGRRRRRGTGRDLHDAAAHRAGATQTARHLPRGRMEGGWEQWMGRGGSDDEKMSPKYCLPSGLMCSVSCAIHTPKIMLSFARDTEASERTPSSLHLFDVTYCTTH